MKLFLKTILSFSFIFFVFFIKGQNIEPQPGDNLLNAELNKYVGTWKWESNGTSLTIVFKKVNAKVPVTMNLYADILFGYHQYKVNNTIVEDSLPFINATFNQKKYTIITFGTQPNLPPNRISVGFNHPSKNKSVQGEFEYIDANHIKIVSLKNYQGIKVNLPGQPPYDNTITLPQNIILTKQ
ncbi:hypothetical protein EIZ47_04040 [Chryseobacterium lacus]|uniref:DUF6705 domain-containing protein n=1 Tax=Chryseobacterium lacus TaxID=2058346 RepID=A0A368N156_9FLAO|nr:DUF6705 family protein [Chryseobacterium lacus]RCU43354.1 hypothetical protein DQ356_04080 [Chryseobacterium lacus]RST28366.1 hypothetical protein EIZ47_04040 [Chryseobacterium lacus]